MQRKQQRPLLHSELATGGKSLVDHHRALKQGYECLARGVPDPLLANTTHKAERNALHDTIGMERLLAVERATVEK